MCELVGEPQSVNDLASKILLLHDLNIVKRDASQEELKHLQAGLSDIRMELLEQMENDGPFALHALEKVSKRVYKEKFGEVSIKDQVFDDLPHDADETLVILTAIRDFKRIIGNSIETSSEESGIEAEVAAFAKSLDTVSPEDFDF